MVEYSWQARRMGTFTSYLTKNLKESIGLVDELINHSAGSVHSFFLRITAATQLEKVCSILECDRRTTSHTIHELFVSPTPSCSGSCKNDTL
jgi:hypothetical protein